MLLAPHGESLSLPRCRARRQRRNTSTPRRNAPHRGARTGCRPRPAGRSRVAQASARQRVERGRTHRGSAARGRRRSSVHGALQREARIAVGEGIVIGDTAVDRRRRRGVRVARPPRDGDGANGREGADDRRRRGRARARYGDGARRYVGRGRGRGRGRARAANLGSRLPVGLPEVELSEPPTTPIPHSRVDGTLRVRGR